MHHGPEGDPDHITTQTPPRFKYRTLSLEEGSAFLASGMTLDAWMKKYGRPVARAKRRADARAALRVMRRAENAQRPERLVGKRRHPTAEAGWRADRREALAALVPAAVAQHAVDVAHSERTRPLSTYREQVRRLERAYAAGTIDERLVIEVRIERLERERRGTFSPPPG